MLVAFVTLSARVQHGVLRSKHWLAPAVAAVAAVALFGPYKCYLVLWPRSTSASGGGTRLRIRWG